jgi:hypothetical protein
MDYGFVVVAWSIPLYVLSFLEPYANMVIYVIHILWSLCLFDDIWDALLSMYLMYL